MTELKQLQNIAAQAERAFFDECSKHWPDGRWGFYRAAAKDEAMPPAVKEAFELHLQTARAYYSARDGEGLPFKTTIILSSRMTALKEVLPPDAVPAIVDWINRTMPFAAGHQRAASLWIGKWEVSSRIHNKLTPARERVIHLALERDCFESALYDRLADSEGYVGWRGAAVKPLSAVRQTIRRMLARTRTVPPQQRQYPAKSQLISRERGA